jgi:hypothetical protein
MRLHKASPGLLLIITLLALPFVVGSSCIVIFGSGDGSNNNWNPDNDDDDDDEEEEEEEEEELVLQSGNFSAPATEGLNYQSGSVSGITGEGGEFQYEQDQPVQFSIGDIKLGSAVAGKPVVTTQDLVASSSDAGTAATNLSRLLQSLDSDPADGIVSIPAVAREAADESDASVSAAIASLDFADETSFVNAASQLVATLTESYPFTATLVDAQSAQSPGISSDSDPGSNAQPQ